MRFLHRTPRKSKRVTKQAVQLLHFRKSHLPILARDGAGQKNPVIGSTMNCPITILNAAATKAITKMRHHDAGRLNPIMEKRPSRSRIDRRPSTDKTSTWFGPTV